MDEDELVPWYLNTERIKLNAMQIFQDAMSFLVLYNYIIPISLYVTLEFQKFLGSLFLVWDLNLYDEETGQPAKCNSSDLNEELGQVKYNCIYSYENITYVKTHIYNRLPPFPPKCTQNDVHLYLGVVLFA